MKIQMGLLLSLFAALISNTAYSDLIQTETANKISSFESFVKEKLNEKATNTELNQALISRINSRKAYLGSDLEPGDNLLPPVLPNGEIATMLGDSDAVIKYKKQLKSYHSQRLILDELRNEYEDIENLAVDGQVEGLTFSELNYADLADKIQDLNGSIFWAPASKANDIINQAGDEIRAVFGSIPPFDLSTLGERTTSDGFIINTKQSGLEVDGNLVVLKPNLNKPGNPLEWEHKDLNGNIIKWTTSIQKCDKPSLAGGVTPCGTSSRISRVTRSDTKVEWLALARKSDGVSVLSNDVYWSPSDTSYALIGYIGFNPISGEIAFFDGANPSKRQFNWNALTIPPGGAGYNDTDGRAKAETTYESTFVISCHACHDNLDPIITTPYLKLERVGYRNSDRARLGSVGDIFPENIRKENKPYRVVGTGYTSTHSETIKSAYIIGDPEPEKICTNCHTITNTGTARFAADSVGRLKEYDMDVSQPPSTNPGLETTYRTDWSNRNGGGIHPWMVPDDGQDLTNLPPEITELQWQRLKAAVTNPMSLPNSKRVFTKVPAPESRRSDITRTKDRSKPTLLDPTVIEDNSMTIISVNWTYHNSFGGVPTRDDVRFHVAIREVDLSENQNEPFDTEYPSMEIVRGELSAPIKGQIFRQDDAIVIKNVSFEGHQKWTDPAPSNTARTYKVKFPARKGKRYLVRLLPKRFGFDQSGEVFSTSDKHTQFIDIP